MYVEWQEFIHVQFVETITQGKTREKREKKNAMCNVNCAIKKFFCLLAACCSHVFFKKKR